MMATKQPIRIRVLLSSILWVGSSSGGDKERHLFTVCIRIIHGKEYYVNFLFFFILSYFTPFFDLVKNRKLEYLYGIKESGQ